MRNLIPVGARVRTPNGTGTVVGGTMWDIATTDPGDRVVRDDVTGDRLVWDSVYLTQLTSVVVTGVGRHATDDPSRAARVEDEELDIRLGDTLEALQRLTAHMPGLAGLHRA